MIAVVIVDDHPVVRAGMRTVLDAAADIAVVAEGVNGAEAVHLVTQHHPDVLVLDVNLPDLSGLEAALYAIRHGLVQISPAGDIQDETLQ